MRTRNLAATSACAAAAWVIVGAGYAAAETPASTAQATSESSITILAQQDDDQLTPQSPGSPDGQTGGLEQEKTPKTGGVRWEEFGGDPADAPKDMDSFITDILGWLKTIAGIAAVIGVLVVASLMVIGLRGRSEAAKKALDGLWPIVLGTIIAGSAYTVVSIFM